MSNSQLAISTPTMMALHDVEALIAMAKGVAMSGFVNSSSNNPAQKAADAFFVMKLGMELGIQPMTALQTIYVVKGKPTCSGQALLGLMRKGGCVVEVPDPSTVKDSATVRVKRPGATEFKEFTFTMQMAKKAGLSSTTWTNYPQTMLIWRAVSTAARMEASDIVGGMYTVEEMAPNARLDEDGTPIDYAQLTSGIVQEEPKDTWPEGEPGDGFTAIALAIRWLSDTEGLSYCEVKTKYGVVSKRSEDMFVEACYLTEGELVGGNEMGKWCKFMPINERPLMMMNRDEQGRVIIDSVEEVFETYPPNEDGEAKGTSSIDGIAPMGDWMSPEDDR